LYECDYYDNIANTITTTSTKLTGFAVYANFGLTKSHERIGRSICQELSGWEKSHP
jgi:hypothetical protein